MALLALEETVPETEADADENRLEKDGEGFQITLCKNLDQGP